MKATELIAKLAKLVQEYGDLELTAYHPHCEPCEVDVRSVSYAEQKGFPPVFEIYGE